MGKLVRDKIPEIIQTNGDAQIRKATGVPLIGVLFTLCRQ